MKNFTNLPPKGTSDWMPEEFRVRKYIFDTWRKVCKSFGYQEYLTPLVEYAEIYRAKSGEDVGGKELTTFRDRGDRELAIRPEMTPSVTRMVSRIYENSPKPLRFFSIANFMRNEKPQKGRNREFWQLNCDIFGSDKLNSDIEVLQLALEIMRAFNAPKESYTFYINNRKLIDFVLDRIIKVETSTRVDLVRVLDKWNKLNEEDLVEIFKDLNLSGFQVENLKLFMKSQNGVELLQNLPDISESEGYKEILKVESALRDMGYGANIVFNPSIIRGFDYYDGMIFEVYDNNPENRRAMFGGGRYNGLASLFGSKSFPAVGFAPGDETTKIFLENWNLVPNDLKVEEYYFPVLQEDFEQNNFLVKKLRSEGKNVIQGIEVQKVGKALEYANKINCEFVVLFGENERSRGVYIIKDMKSGEQREVEVNNEKIKN